MTRISHVHVSLRVVGGTLTTSESRLVKVGGIAHRQFELEIYHVFRRERVFRDKFNPKYNRREGNGHLAHRNHAYNSLADNHHIEVQYMYLLSIIYTAFAKHLILIYYRDIYSLVRRDIITWCITCI